MDGFKEFTGKSLDDAISEACSFFDTTRERLELDIVQDAKSGIFGLVGARKAVVRARRVQLRSAMEDILGRNKGAEAANTAKNSEDKIERAHSESPTQEKIKKLRAEKKENRNDHDGKDSKEVKDTRAVKPSRGRSADADAQGQKRDAGQRSAAREARESKEPRDSRDIAQRTEKSEKAEQGRNGKKPISKEQEKGRKERLARNQPKGQKEHGQRHQRHENDDIYALPDDVDGNKIDATRSTGRGERRYDSRSEHRKAHSRNMHSPAPHAHISEEGGNTTFDDGEETENVRRIPLHELDQERLSQVTLEVVGLLTRYIVGEVPMSMKLHEGRIQVHLDCEENSGLLIGREGQTLAALQYVISRIVSREMDAVVRVQLDAGDYRTRQDEKLSDLALVLAERVRTTGKPHSTRPLSSYHRRIVHVALQEVTDLVTRSSGDGPLKRVIIQRKRS